MMTVSECNQHIEEIKDLLRKLGASDMPQAVEYCNHLRRLGEEYQKERLKALKRPQPESPEWGRPLWGVDYR